MTRTRTLALALVAAALLQAGCSGFIDKPQRPVLFDMGPTRGAISQAAQTDARVPLILPEIEASGALDSSAVLYRLGYSDDHELRAYSQSRWSAPPPQLVRQRLREQLGRDRPVLTLDESSALDRHRPHTRASASGRRSTAAAPP